MVSRSLKSVRAQADRRALNITMNSIGTELTRDDRRKLYSNFGLLYPHGHSELASAEDFDQIRSAMEKCPPYQAIFNKVHPPRHMGDTFDADRTLLGEVRICCGAFVGSAHKALAGLQARVRALTCCCLLLQMGYGESQMLDKILYEEEARRSKFTFEQQFHYGVFFAYMRLREQEIRNLMWVSECVAQDQKNRVTDGIVYLF